MASVANLCLCSLNSIGLSFGDGKYYKYDKAKKALDSKKGVWMKLIGKRGQEASSWGHLGGWIIALAVLIFLVILLLVVSHHINFDAIRNARFS